jgi:hypothetical protein
MTMTVGDETIALIPWPPYIHANSSLYSENGKCCNIAANRRSFIFQAATRDVAITEEPSGKAPGTSVLTVSARAGRMDWRLSPDFSRVAATREKSACVATSCHAGFDAVLARLAQG